MKATIRIMSLSLIAALPVYMLLEQNMPNLPLDAVYGVAAGSGFVIGVVLNYLWVALSKKSGAK